MARRQVTTAVTMLALCGILVIGAVLGWKSLSADLPGTGGSSAEPSPSCATQTVHVGQRIRSSDVQVSVFNGGTRSGLAEKTLKALARRGFTKGVIGNAPSDARVRRAQVWSTEQHDASARLVARQFGKKVKVRFSDTDLGPGVDVIVGDGYRKLAKAKRSIRAHNSQQVCAPTDNTNTASN